MLDELGFNAELESIDTCLSLISDLVLVVAMRLTIFTGIPFISKVGVGHRISAKFIVFFELVALKTILWVALHLFEGDALTRLLIEIVDCSAINFTCLAIDMYLRIVTKRSICLC